MMKAYGTLFGMFALATLAAGCSSEPTSETNQSQRQPTAEGAKYLLSESPEGAQEVIPARKDAKNDQEVVVVGRIGGNTNPWIDGRAAFSIVDRSLKACSDIPGDNCPTPWDYCCEADIASATTLVKVVDAEGNLLDTGARELLGLDELQTVVVKGKAQRDDAGNVTILASGIYVDPTEQVPAGDAKPDAAHAHDHDHEHHDHDHADEKASPDEGEHSDHEHAESEPDAEETSQ